ncbi:hypothetical protein [Streptomyces sp. NPDC029526]|uniref:hypothetical protein n=1 Tax=Streptomyces sp. NPDC029526 TaxID=3155728 RepID=UPI0034102BE4
MDQDTSASRGLPQPLRAVVSGLRHLPGAGQAGKVAGGALDAIGAVSPRGRRVAVYTGAGVLGVAGIVEWPVAVTGAAVAWLTRPRPAHPDGAPAPHPPADAETTDNAESTETGPATDPSAGPDADGPGDRLESARHRPAPPEHTAHEQPAKVGDTATASALKQVAEATAHHEPHPTRQRADDTAGGNGRHDA